MKFFYELWKDSAFGKNPNGVERAGWILKGPEGQLIFQKWRNSDERNKEVWKGPAPSNRVGVVHTHPVQRDPKPSPADVSFGKKLNIPVYVVSENGVWMSTSAGKKSRVMNYLRFKAHVTTCSSTATQDTSNNSQSVE